MVVIRLPWILLSEPTIDLGGRRYAESDVTGLAP
jgi:hypothetical protein